jgi:hypothetical protein
MFIHFPLTCLLDFLFIFVLSFYIRRDAFPLNTKKRKGTFRSLCASGRIVFHFHGRIPPCLSAVATILSQKNLFIKSSCAPFFVKRKPLAFFFSSFADILASRGSRRRRRDALHRVKALLLSVEKQNGQVNTCPFCWRRNRDLNPGYASHVLLP